MIKKAISVCALVVLLGLVVDGYGRRTQPVTNSWEYLVISDETRYSDKAKDGLQKLNDLGKDGWELVGISDQVTSDALGSQARLFFKRAK
jgi:hypothetical protein